MVNLFLTGHAASNVFNDVVELDSGTGDKTVLKGIQRRCDIGFLSLFEHYKSCQVRNTVKQMGVHTHTHTHTHTHVDNVNNTVLSRGPTENVMLVDTLIAYKAG